MKKRTLVCFLIFTLCVFYSSIPNTVLGQEASLAQQVFDKHSETLQRADIQAVLPQVLEGLKSDQIQGILGANPALIGTVVAAPDLLLNFAPDTPPEFITLLKEDAALQAMLNDPVVQSLLADVEAIDELAGLLGVGAEPPVVEPPVVEPPVVEPPVVEPPPVEIVTPADPFDQVMPLNESILGKSRLGGLSLNKISMRRLVAEIFEGVTGQPIETLANLGLTQDQLIKMVVEEIANIIPEGVPFPKRQLLQVLGSNHIKFFAEELDGKDLAQGLDYENFGNAVTPMLLELLWDDMQGDLLYPNRKYLTRDDLSLYVRVPSTNVEGVRFELTNGTMVEGQRVNDPAILGSDSIPYTFQLEEALAATNLPGWPALEDNLEQLFERVVLRYSDTLSDSFPFSAEMQPTFGPKGVVWEAEIGVTPGNLYYYFEVTLANPVTLEILDREELANLFRSALEGNSPTIADVLYATTSYEIKMWSMPDPRNLQLADRGIINALFDEKFRTAAGRALDPVIGNSLATGQLPTPQQLLGALTKHQARLQNILLRNANTVVTRFEEAFDPMLASVFSVPHIDPQSESLWVAKLDNIPNGNHYLGAFVYDADGNSLDLMQGEFTVDNRAPEADVAIDRGNTNTAVYKNNDDVYVATAPTSDVAATLNITGLPTRGPVAPGEGYLLYQIVRLNPDGTPYQGESSLERPNTWMPLTIESTVLASTVWDETIAQLVGQGVLPAEIDFGGSKIPTETLSLETVLGVLGTPIGLGFIQDNLNPTLKTLGNALSINLQLDDQAAQLLVDIFGKTVDLFNAVPITFGDPHNTVVMPIQGEGMSLLTGEYGIRALGIDTLFNVSSYTPPTRLRIVPPEADAASVTAVSIGDRNGDGDTDEPYESGTIFANATDGVMLTVTVDNRTVHPASISVEYMDANGAWQTIETLTLAENEELAMDSVSWDVTDFEELVAAGNTVMVRAVATNKLGLIGPSEPFAINLDAGVHPVDFDVIALALDSESITQTNPDSGGPQGTVTISGYTPERTYPEVASFQLKIAGEVVGVTGEGVVITAEEFKALEDNADVIDDLLGLAAGTVALGAASEASIYRDDYPPNLMKWTVTVDTTALEDTITAESTAVRDATKDENQYIVTASALTDAGELPAPANVKSHLSVDNVDDVGPIGPTNIVAVTNVADGVAPQPVEANEDGSYTVGGIVDEAVPSPMDMLTIEPTADPKTYASVKLIQTDAEGNETVTDGEAGVLDITVDVSMLENGTYMFHALAVDEFGNVQTDASPQTAVHVVNFRLSDVTDLAVTAVDGVDVAEPPAEPIPLRDSLTVGFMVANGSLAADQLSASINGAAVASESAEDPEMTFSLSVMEISALPDGAYTPEGVVTQWNGSVSFALAMINLDNTGPMVTIQTPSEDHTVDSLPTLHATYEDGAGSGADADGTGVLAWATTELANGPTVMLTRMLPEQGDQDIMVDQGAVETNESTLVYTRTEQLPGGAYSATVQVADVLGNIGEASVEFAISGTLPAVAIHSPSSGQTFEHGAPLISGEFSGAGTVEVTTFTVNDVDATPAVDGNRFSYTPEDALADGNHTVVVAVTDGDGNTAETSVSFTVKVPRDTTPPVISAAAPSGVVKGDSWVTLSAVVTDDQSSIVSAKFGINDKPFRSIPLAQIAQGRIETADSFTAGTHTITVVAISEGGTTQHSWTFTLEVDNVAPTITSITPTGTLRGGLPTISASANDASGVDEINIVVLDSDGEEVEGGTEDDGEDDVEGITRVDFIPEAPLDEGTYTIQVRATDTIGNSATAQGAFSIDFDTAAPIITMSSPQNEARLTERRPQISISFADAESGVDVDSIRFVLDDNLINLKPDQKSASQVIYTPDLDLAFGQHSVKLEVSDMAHKEGNVSEDSSGAREANMAVHEFTFFVESEAGPVLASRPINAPNPFKDNTRISFTLTRQSTVSIVIYDMTLRPVRVLVDNEVWDAGEYVGKGAIGWDGTSSSGEDLARGVYFCQIMVADGFEPEYAILKLALTR